MFRKWLAVAAAAALTLPLAACVNADTGSAAGGDKDSITIGIKYDQPGLGLREGDEYTGFDVDVARYIAKKLGYSEDQITWKQTPSPQRETMLQSGQVDMIVASYSITDTRKEKVDFAGPYFVAGQDLLVKAGNTSITGPASLNDPKKKLCSVSGSTSAQHVKDDYPKVQLQNYDTYSKCVQAVSTGAVDALTTDDIILAGYAAQPQYKGKLKVVGKPFSEERYGVGLKKGDTQMCQKVTDAIKAMIDDGTWSKLLDKNVGDADYTPNAEKNPPKEFEACS